MQEWKIQRTEVALQLIHEAVVKDIVTPLGHAPGTPLNEQLRIYARSVRKDAARQLRWLRFSFSTPRIFKTFLKTIKKEARFLEKNAKEIAEEYQYHFFCSGDWIKKTIPLVIDQFPGCHEENLMKLINTKRIKSSTLESCHSSEVFFFSKPQYVGKFIPLSDVFTIKSGDKVIGQIESFTISPYKEYPKCYEMTSTQKGDK